MTARLLLSLEDVALSFGGKPLFEELTIHITEGDNICLIGRNGAGKTTLMKLITGELEAASGKRFVLPGLRIGYLQQNVTPTEGQQVVDFILDGLPRDDSFEEKRYLADMVMAPLEVPPGAQMQHLSGGQLRRAALAQALVAEPDVLLLDEPTNHLDLQAIQWLEEYLARYRGAVLCISHDRAFLKTISRKVFWLDRGTVKTCPYGFDRFEDWAQEQLELEARTLHNMEKKLQAEVDWTQGGVTGRRKRNQRRMRELHRLREALQQGKSAYRTATRGIELEPLEASQASKIIGEFKAVSKAYTRGGDTVPILDGLSMRVMRGERIGILGRNGSGKSTFLKLLTGEIEPDSGHIRRGKTIDVSYFDQNRSDLNLKKTVWDTLCPDGGDYVFLGSEENPKPIHVCGYLKTFLFDPRIARELVGTLSGGQQNRLLLAKVLARPGNVLILDEPTNDLDMDTLDMLQGILADYPGTLLLVSHDRDFLDRTVTRVLAFEGNGEIASHPGGYTDYLQWKQAQGSGSNSSGKAAPAAASGSKNTTPGKASPASGKMSFKLKHELGALPQRIARLEQEIATLKATLDDADLYSRAPDTFDNASKRLPEAEEELSAAETRWLELSDMQESS